MFVSSQPLSDRLQAALVDPDTQVVMMGPRATWARLMTRSIATAALFATLGAGLWVGGAKVADMSGLKAELQGRSTPMQVLPQRPQRVRWLDMPSSPFLDVARRPDGSYSVDGLVGAYKEAGLSVEQARAVAHRLRALSPVLMGANDPVLAQRLQREARIAAAGLLHDYPDAARRLQHLIARHRLPASRQVGVWTTRQNWAAVRAEVLDASHEAADPDAIGQYPDMQMEEARGALEEAVRETGLRALRVAPASMAGPQTLSDLAHGLREANEDLQSASGWDGQVLGLGGRVVLSMGSPPVESNALGLTSAVTDGSIQIQAQWDCLAHEWFHAVDFIAAQHALVAPITSSMSNQLQPLRMAKDAGVVDAWKLAVWKLMAATPQWQHARHEYIQQVEEQGNDRSISASTNTGAVPGSAAYWASNVEQLAFAFQSYVGNGPSTVLKLRKNEERLASSLPGPKEAQALKPVWDELFQSMGSLHLAKPMPAELQSRLDDRRQVASTRPALRRGM